MNFHVRSFPQWYDCLFSGMEALRNSFCVKEKFSEPSLLEPGFARLGTDTDNRDSQSECTGEQQKCLKTDLESGGGQFPR